MATPIPLVVSPRSLAKLRDFLCRTLDYSKSRTDFRNKLDMIDYAYYRYQQAKKNKDKAGMDTYGKTECNATAANIVNPVVISQVDSIVAYWAEVFLSGYPLFPVVSNPDTKRQAEALEGLMQDHLVLSQSIPELQLVLRNAGKYNLFAADFDWVPIDSYKPEKTLVDLANGESKNQTNTRHINGVKNIDLRNFHFDDRVDFADLDREGDYAGYTKIKTRVGLKQLLNYLSNEGILSSPEAPREAMASSMDTSDWTDPPIVSEYYEGTRVGGTNWDAFAGFTPETPDNVRSKIPANSTNTYLLHKFYVRLIPIEFGLNVPNKRSPQVFRIRMVNRSTIISVEHFTGAQGRLGIVTGQAIEDGFEMQTQGYAELSEPIQDATTRLFNARFHIAHRLIADRALYNPDVIRSSDINNPNPASKIPVRANALQDFNISNAYYQIPFSYQGSESLLQDAMLINSWQSDMTGINSASRGQFTKGNRTMAEFESINSSAQNRQRLSALVLEYRFFQKLKDQFKLNILQFGEDTEVISPRNGIPLNVSIEELQRMQLQFEVADGYTPKSKMANTEFLASLINLIGTSPILQQVMGSQLPGMLAHLAQLGGLRGFDQYATVALEEWQKSFTMQSNIQQMLMAIGQQMGIQSGAQSGQEQQQ